MTSIVAPVRCLRGRWRGTRSARRPPPGGTISPIASAALTRVDAAARRGGDLRHRRVHDARRDARTRGSRRFAWLRAIVCATFRTAAFDAAYAERDAIAEPRSAAQLESATIVPPPASRKWRTASRIRLTGSRTLTRKRRLPVLVPELVAAVERRLEQRRRVDDDDVDAAAPRERLGEEAARGAAERHVRPGRSRRRDSGSERDGSLGPVAVGSVVRDHGRAPRRRAPRR